MHGWFVDIAGPTLGTALFWLAATLALIFLFLAVYWLFRRAASGNFISGGRNRRPRLAVIDVAAVDSRRRLVLVRRDEIEHLILIGGPSDLVIEQGIRKRMQEPRLAAEPVEPPRIHETHARPASAIVEPEPPVPAISDATNVTDAVPVPPVSEPAQAVVPPVTAPFAGPAMRPQSESPAPPSSPRFGTMARPPQQDRPEPAQPHAAKQMPPRIEPEVELPAPRDAEPRPDFDAELLRELDAEFADKSKATPIKPEEALSSIFADIVRKHRS